MSDRPAGASPPAGRAGRPAGGGTTARAMLAIAGLLLADASAAADPAPAPVARCIATASTPAPPRAVAMAAAAIEEHTLFGRQALDVEGRLVRAGASEAEAGFPGHRSVFATAPWQRVLAYWRAVGDDEDDGAGLPDQVRFGALRPASRRLLGQALDQAAAPRLRGLGAAPGQGLESSELRALGAALDRVAVMDTPWSAAFVSWLARTAGLGAGEFVFSEAHVDYAGAAWQAGADENAGRPVRHALRACDITTTPPRVGDLICQTRGAGAGLDQFETLGRVLAERPTGGRAVPMHCDVVTAVDDSGFDAVGGNVLQSVTLRRLAFAPGTHRLDPSYLMAECTSGVGACIDRHMSHQPWSLLLQWR